MFLDALSLAVASLAPTDRGTFLFSMRYSIMVSQTALQKKIANTEELIARAEERVRKLQAKAEPGTARLVQGLTNSIRKHRRELHKLSRQREPTNHQLREQQRQMQQAQRDAPAGPNSELPERQDQEPRKPASQQGFVGGQ